MTKTYAQLCVELAPLQAKADRLERDLVAFDAWIVSEEGQRFLDLREARDDAFYALPIAEQERIEAQRVHGEARQHARAMIETGANPDWFVHLVTFPDYPEGTHCSTPIPHVESGMTSRYYRLGDVAAWEA